DVVGFAVGGGPVATVPAASAVAHGERDALAGGVAALLAPEVQRVTIARHLDGDRSGVADVLLGDGARQAAETIFVVGTRLFWRVRVDYPHDAYTGLLRAEHGLRVRKRARLHEVQ